MWKPGGGTRAQRRSSSSRGVIAQRVPAVGERALHPVEEGPVRCLLEALQRQRGSEAVLAEPLETLSVVRVDANTEAGPDVVLLDLMMPRMSGEALLDRLREVCFTR